MSLTVEALDHLVINVESVDISAEWYQRVLGMHHEISGPEKGKMPRTSLKFGEQKINLRPSNAKKSEWFTADHEKPGSQDLCFLTPSKPQEVIEHLGSCSVEVEVGPVEKQGARGTLMSVYCRDPDGNLIEISSYIQPS